ILEERTPQTKVLLLGVFPRGEGRWDQGRINNQGINDLIAHHADGERVRYMDLGTVFMEPDGSLSREIMPDLLHLSPAGYERWATAMEPVLKEMGL
ncbi:MAG TPA: acetylglucosamine-6-sulfatase, partial [Verrucomicrobia bacterium]|nr:acetylglucosamine-6-sulfatase [Verrucomicrobiota bacterium]